MQNGPEDDCILVDSDFEDCATRVVKPARKREYTDDASVSSMEESSSSSESDGESQPKKRKTTIDATIDALIGSTTEHVSADKSDDSRLVAPSVHLQKNWYNIAGGPRWFLGCLGAFMDHECQVSTCKTSDASVSDVLIEAIEAMTYISRASAVSCNEDTPNTLSHQTVNDVEIVYPEHISRYLFESTAVIGSRSCVCGTRCKAFLHWAHPLSTPQQSSDGSTVRGVGVILREFLGPKDEHEFYATGHLPEHWGPCIACIRCMVRAGMQKVSLGQAERCIPPHCNPVGTVNAYKADAMLMPNIQTDGISTMGVCLPFRDYRTSDYHPTTLEDSVHAGIVEPDLANLMLREIAENGTRLGFFGMNGRVRPCDLPSMDGTIGTVYSRSAVDAAAAATAAAAMAVATISASAANAATEAVDSARAKAAYASLNSTKMAVKEQKDAEQHAARTLTMEPDTATVNDIESIMGDGDVPVESEQSSDALGARGAATERREELALKAAVRVLDQQERTSRRNPRGYLEDARVYFFGETRWLSTRASRCNSAAGAGSTDASEACIVRHAWSPGFICTNGTLCDGSDGCCAAAIDVPVEFGAAATAALWVSSLAPPLCQNPTRQLQQFSLLLWQRQQLIVVKRTPNAVHHGIRKPAKESISDIFAPDDSVESEQEDMLVDCDEVDEDAIPCVAETNVAHGCRCRCHISHGKAASVAAGCHRCSQFHPKKDTHVAKSKMRTSAAVISSVKQQIQREQHQWYAPRLILVPAAKRISRHAMDRYVRTYTRKHSLTMTYSTEEARFSVLRLRTRGRKRRTHDIADSRSRKLFAQTVMRHWKIPKEWDSVGKALAERYADDPYRARMIPTIMLLPFRNLCAILAAALNPWVAKWWQIPFDSPTLRLLEVISEFVENLSIWDTIAYPVCPWKHTIAIACAARIEIAEEVLCVVRNEHALIRANKGVKAIDEAITEYQTSLGTEYEQQATLKLFARHRDKEHSELLSSILSSSMSSICFEDRRRHAYLDGRTDRDDALHSYKFDAVDVSNRTRTSKRKKCAKSDDSDSDHIPQRRGNKSRRARPNEANWKSHGPRVLDRNGSAAEAMIATHWPLCEAIRQNSFEGLCEDADIADWIACPTGMIDTTSQSVPSTEKNVSSDDGNGGIVASASYTYAPWKRCAGQSCGAVSLQNSTDWEGTDAAAMRLAAVIDSSIISYDGENEEQRRKAHDKQHGYNYSHTYGGAMTGDGGGAKAALDTIVCYCGCNVARQEQSTTLPQCPSAPWSKTYKRGRGRPKKFKRPPPPPIPPVYAFSQESGNGNGYSATFVPPSNTFYGSDIPHSRDQAAVNRSVEICENGKCRGTQGRVETVYAEENDDCKRKTRKDLPAYESWSWTACPLSATREEIRDMEKRTARRVSEQIDRDLDAIEGISHIISAVGMPVLLELDPEDRLCHPHVPRAEDVESIDKMVTAMKPRGKTTIPEHAEATHADSAVHDAAHDAVAQTKTVPGPLSREYDVPPVSKLYGLHADNRLALLSYPTSEEKLAAAFGSPRDETRETIIPANLSRTAKNTTDTLWPNNPSVLSVLGTACEDGPKISDVISNKGFRQALHALECAGPEICTQIVSAAGGFIQLTGYPNAVRNPWIHNGGTCTWYAVTAMIVRCALSRSIIQYATSQHDVALAHAAHMFALSHTMLANAIGRDGWADASSFTDQKLTKFDVDPEQHLIKSTTYEPSILESAYPCDNLVRCDSVIDISGIIPYMNKGGDAPPKSSLADVAMKCMGDNAEESVRTSIDDAIVSSPSIMIPWITGCIERSLCGLYPHALYKPSFAGVLGAQCNVEHITSSMLCAITSERVKRSLAMIGIAAAEIERIVDFTAADLSGMLDRVTDQLTQNKRPAEKLSVIEHAAEALRDLDQTQVFHAIPMLLAIKGPPEEQSDMHSIQVLRSFVQRLLDGPNRNIAMKLLDFAEESLQSVQCSIFGTMERVAAEKLSIVISRICKIVDESAANDAFTAAYVEGVPSMQPNNKLELLRDVLYEEKSAEVAETNDALNKLRMASVYWDVACFVIAETGSALANLSAVQNRGEMSVFALAEMCIREDIHAALATIPPVTMVLSDKILQDADRLRRIGDLNAIEKTAHDMLSQSCSPAVDADVDMVCPVRIGPLSAPAHLQVAQMREFVAAMVRAESTKQGRDDIVRCLSFGRQNMQGQYTQWRDSAVSERFGATEDGIYDDMVKNEYKNALEQAHAVTIVNTMCSAVSIRTVTSVMMQYGAGSWDEIRAQFGAFVYCPTCERILTQMYVVPPSRASSISITDVDSRASLLLRAPPWPHLCKESCLRKPPLNTNFRGKDASVIGLYGVLLCLSSGNLVCAERHVPANRDQISRSRSMLTAWQTLCNNDGPQHISDESLGIVALNATTQELPLQTFDCVETGIVSAWSIGSVIEIRLPHGMHAHKEDAGEKRKTCCICCNCGAMMRSSSADYSLDGRGWECVACQISRGKAPPACRICGSPIVQRVEHGLLLAERRAMSLLQGYERTMASTGIGASARNFSANLGWDALCKNVVRKRSADDAHPHKTRRSESSAIVAGVCSGTGLSIATPWRNIATIESRDVIASMARTIASSRAKRRNNENTAFGRHKAVDVPAAEPAVQRTEGTKVRVESFAAVRTHDTATVQQEMYVEAHHSDDEVAEVEPENDIKPTCKSQRMVNKRGRSIQKTGTSCGQVGDPLHLAAASTLDTGGNSASQKCPAPMLTSASMRVVDDYAYTGEIYIDVCDRCFVTCSATLEKGVVPLLSEMRAWCSDPFALAIGTPVDPGSSTNCDAVQLCTSIRSSHKSAALERWSRMVRNMKSLIVSSQMSAEAADETHNEDQQRDRAQFIRTQQKVARDVALANTETH